MGQNPPMNRLIRPASSATRGRASAQEGRRRASGRRRAFGNSFRPPLLRPYRDNRVIYRERATSLAVLCACAVTLLFFFLVWFLVRDGVGEIDLAVPTLFSSLFKAVAHVCAEVQLVACILIKAYNRFKHHKTQTHPPTNAVARTNALKCTDARARTDAILAMSPKKP